jgi:hypothetical protein
MLGFKMFLFFEYFKFYFLIQLYLNIPQWAEIKF